MRRVRNLKLLRDLTRETRLTADDLIYPLFVTEGTGVADPITTLPGQSRLSVDKLVEECRRAADLGIKAVLLFGVTDQNKDEQGSYAWDPNGVVQRALRAIREANLNMVVMTDVCLCGYTSHGHCGLVKDGEILNDESLELLARMAVSHAKAGAHVVAPSDMFDGRVGAIRSALDEEGFKNTPILSYAAKYASAFYGPFRDACSSSPAFGDRSSHQMDPANAEEALREIELDLEEGADMVMVKPALAYLDIICRVKDAFPGVPLAAYNVSGEYAMVEMAAAGGAGDRDRLILEVLTAIRRAGADLILTYHAPRAAELMK
jgi:porphobilinogen synthase